MYTKTTNGINIGNTFIIEKRKFILPHAIGYFGGDYKNFEFKVGAGYSKFIILGFEYRFKFLKKN
ncbi:hypothetical protein [Caviibacter abscessus]|uniref:hypothetical protein n=1 Tax=Caviibacter abscessus TaxID=1766719 RepID=UPI000837AB8F|nr:hypothetical protein [Caviibacter abscessus]